MSHRICILYLDLDWTSEGVTRVIIRTVILRVVADSVGGGDDVLEAGTVRRTVGYDCFAKRPVETAYTGVLRRVETVHP